MATVVDEGDQSATISTEHTLTTITTAGVYVFQVDLGAMVDAATPDVVRVRVYGKARTTSTERLLEVYEFIGAQGKPLFAVVPRVEASESFRVTLEQIQGTGRTFPWAVVSP